MAHNSRVFNTTLTLTHMLIHYQVTSIENNLIAAHDVYLKWKDNLSVKI